MLLIPSQISPSLARNEELTIRILEGETLKKVGKRYHLSITRVRAIVLQTILKYDKNNPNIKNLSRYGLYPYSGSFAKLREQKDYLVYLITRPLPISKKPPEKSIMDTQYDKITEEVKTLLEPEFAKVWPHANPTTVSIEVDNLIERVAVNIDKLTVNGLFKACVKQL